MKIFICIDIGGTKTRVQARNEKNQMIKKISFFTQKGKPVLTFSKIVSFITYIKKFHTILGIGISAPGPTDYKKGIFYKLPNNPDWINFNFKKYLKEKTNINNIKADNDANLMALAHHFYFKKSNKDITQFFTISTGFGAGLIINNKIYHGAYNNAQEVSFAPTSLIPEESKRFGQGALEQFCSGSGLVERSKNKFNSAKYMFLHYGKNKLATKLINEGIDALSNMIATTISLINPSILVFDGSIARYNNWYVNDAIKKAKKNSMYQHFEKLNIFFGQKGDDAAIEGAFILIKK